MDRKSINYIIIYRNNKFETNCHFFQDKSVFLYEDRANINEKREYTSTCT